MQKITIKYPEREISVTRLMDRVPEIFKEMCDVLQESKCCIEVKDRLKDKSISDAERKLIIGIMFNGVPELIRWKDEEYHAYEEKRKFAGISIPEELRELEMQKMHERITPDVVGRINALCAEFRSLGLSVGADDIVCNSGKFDISKKKKQQLLEDCSVTLSDEQMKVFDVLKRFIADYRFLREYIHLDKICKVYGGDFRFPEHDIKYTDEELCREMIGLEHPSYARFRKLMGWEEETEEERKAREQMAEAEAERIAEAEAEDARERQRMLESGELIVKYL